MDAKLTIVDVTGSTNDDLLEAGKQGAPREDASSAAFWSKLHAITKANLSPSAALASI